MPRECVSVHGDVEYITREYVGMHGKLCEHRVYCMWTGVCVYLAVCTWRKTVLCWVSFGIFGESHRPREGGVL